ncbi:uncharacterized protein Dana_GF16067, isoform A [Drosophila ananassae]|uniref:Uncharacterized protein, isoform A n=1 Tax=Drosophila ananassae TaxID=7217 RepID=B3M171_DROAN|nr:putative cysteine proteinase CG12163 isoform X1 [Drosophila ananassae]EDV44341.1 uncharacterized protein Dana_GF16067, isoform A [Drosophila ananassae]
MNIYAAATVALILLLGQAAGDVSHLAEEGVEDAESAVAETTTTSEAATDQTPVSEPAVKLVHVLNPGEREYLSPNLIGVQNIAMTFLPLSMNFVNIIDAFREITSGVRYEILLNAVDTKVKQPEEADTICRLVILEKPWLRTQWGDKHRELVTSNCSDSSENTLTGGEDPGEKARLLNEKYVSRSRRSINDVLVGDHKPYDEKQAREQLQRSLNKLTEGEGPHYKILKVYSATRQVVSGTLTRIDADLLDSSATPHRCVVEIWAQPWLTQHEVIFKCRNQPVVHARHSRAAEWAEKKSHKKHNHHSLDKVEHLFHKFQVRFGRRYVSTAERQMRLRIFRQNLKTIEELNANEMGSAKYGITEFADMTSTEYKERTGLWQRDEAKATGGSPAVVPAYSGELPKEFDWRSKNAVTGVKNQGQCGSCWAFSVTGNIEGLYALKYGELKEFSEQELLDCDTTDSACNGGLMDNAYKAIKDIGGLEYEAEYPYEAKKKQCHFNKTMSHVQVKDFVDLPKGNETAMQEWLVSNGPISIGINANAMQFYRGGVSHPWKALCSKKNLDHGVLVVGYGVSDYPNYHKTLPYWIVKNSWGPRWGEQGYYRVYRGDNTCGVSEMATSAVLA